MTNILRRIIHPEIRIVDAKTGVVDYVASDETLDAYKEVIRAGGWKFTNFRKNAPFVDTHDYGTIDKLLGKVIEFRVDGKQLLERVKWAIEVATNTLAQKGWQMTEAGYLKAVSVGFTPNRYVTRYDSDPSGWRQQLSELGMHEEDGVRLIYVEQEQQELSACILGANPNALAKAYKAGILSDADFETFSQLYSPRENAGAAFDPVAAALATQRARTEFLEKLTNAVKAI